MHTKPAPKCVNYVGKGSRWNRALALFLAARSLSAAALKGTGKAESSGSNLRGNTNALTFPVPPDTRPQACSEPIVIEDPEGKEFRDLKTSIIIPFRHEKLEHIRGTVASVLHFTPKHLLSEILFVSDGNDPKTALVDEIRSMSPLISLLILPPPGVGLIAAKMRAVGAVALETQVLMFLEPHTRVNRNWLQALLVRIRKFPKVLAMPFLDIIPQDHFESYRSGAPGHWRFEWNLNLIYTNPGRRTGMEAEPYMSPATSGGIFAIHKDWWNKLGFYDAGMIGWGGDHLEATAKVWRCGGHIEIVPCSRIGHLFRDASHRPYDVEVPQVVHNYARFAEIWLDEYRSYFYKMKPEAAKMKLGNLTEARSTREHLKCRNMSWFLKNVEHEMLWEKDQICVPGCDRHRNGPICCEHPGAPGHSTIDRTVPPDEYEALPLPKDSQAVEWIDADPSEFEL